MPERHEPMGADARGSALGPVLWVHLGEADPQILPPLQARIEALAETEIALIARYSLPDLVRGPHAGARERPDLVLWADGPLDAAALDAVRGVDRLVLPFEHTAAMPGGFLRRRAARASLARCRILSPSEEALKALRRETRAALTAEVTGPLQAAPAPPPYDAERHARVAAAVAGRPVWFAPAVPPHRTSAILAAHAEVSKRFHRLLLVLESDDATEWETADPPTDRDSVVRARGREERGLWYRIAPITFMGDSFDPGGTTDPLEPAALGSAVIHGGAPGARRAAYARLSGARASRYVDDPGGLADAIEALMAPDRAALLAQAAWAEVTRGATATDRAAEVAIELLERTGAL